MQYKGVSRRPDDISAKDGELSLAINVINEDGNLRPLDLPKYDFTLSNIEHRLLYVHADRLIIESHGDLYWGKKGEDSVQSPLIFRDIDPIIDITSIGNTLIVATKNTILYALWSESSYKPLGDKLPFPELSFSLNGTFQEETEPFEVFDGDAHLGFHYSSEKEDANGYFSFDDYRGEGFDDLLDHHINVTTDIVLPHVNKFIQEEVREKNKFIYPFFVRYCLKLYDGSSSMHSAPVLLVPLDECNPVLYTTVYGATNNSDDKMNVFMQAKVSAYVCSLIYSMLQTPDDLQNWSDIIKSIDIYVSAPIYTYDQSGKVKGWRYTGEKLYRPRYFEPEFHGYYGGNHFNVSFSDLFSTKHPGKFSDTLLGVAPSTHKIDLPEISQAVINEKISSCGNFYKISSIKIEDLKVCNNKVVEIGDKVINTIEQQEQMKDDYKSHNHISAKCMFPYNSRLNLANVTETVFSGFSARSMQPISEDHRTIQGYNHKFWDVYTYLKKNGKRIVVKSESNGIIDSAMSKYLFYPDSDAFEMHVMPYFLRDDGSKNYYDKTRMYKLKAHPLLNGAYFFRSLKNCDPDFVGDHEPTPTSALVDYPSKIYTSYTDNPFVFGPENINTVGTGEVKALCSASKPLSQGQFGQFPLYAFSTDGIWALISNLAGGWETKQPVVRDVLVGLPLQLDSAVAFISDKGLMILSGSECKCVSEQLRATCDLSGYKNLPQLIQLMGQNNLKGIELPLNPIMAYDYARSRIFLFGNSSNYSWVYSLQSGLWSMTDVYFDNAVNSYPGCVLTLKEKVFSLSATDKAIPEKGMILTRPIKFESTELKTVYSVITRQISSDVVSALFGTVDFNKFTLVKSSINEKILNICGSPYRAYSLLLGLKLNEHSSVVATDFIQAPRLENKLR